MSCFYVSSMSSTRADCVLWKHTYTDECTHAVWWVKGWPSEWFCSISIRTIFALQVKTKVIIKCTFLENRMHGDKMCTQSLVSQMRIQSTPVLCSPSCLHWSQACHFYDWQIQDPKHELCFPSTNAGLPKNGKSRSAQHLGYWMSKIERMSDDLALAWSIRLTGKSVYEVRHELGWRISSDMRKIVLLSANLKVKRNKRTVPRSKRGRKDCLGTVSFSFSRSRSLTFTLYVCHSNLDCCVLLYKAFVSGLLC